MSNNQEKTLNLIVPCIGDKGVVVGNLNVQYKYKGSELVEMGKASMEDPIKFAQLDRVGLLTSLLNTASFFGVQSEHSRRQWQRLEKENKLLTEAYQKVENDKKDMIDKISALIEQGVITQEQFDSALNNSRAKQF